MKSEQRVQAVKRNMRGMLPIGWGLGDSFGSITLHRARVRNSSCYLLRRERTAWNGSHFVANVALMDEAGASNDN
jgi:hypothetical protein